MASHTLFKCDLPSFTLYLTRTAKIALWLSEHELFTHFVMRSAMKEILIGILVISQSDGSKILILHLWMRFSKDHSFKTADF
jgi:hypothetical protein